MKWAILAVVVAFTPIAMAAQDHPASTQHAGNKQQADAAVTRQEVGANQNTENRNDYPQGWHKFVTWPESIAAWAIMLTFGAIIWQSYETRRAVLVNLRPKLIIRGVDLSAGVYTPVVGQEENRPWQIHCLIANVGGSVARITESNLTVDLVDRVNGELPVFPPYDKDRKWLRKMKIRPGEEKKIESPLETVNAVRFRFYQIRKQGGATAETAMYCLGFMRYRDKLRVKRKTAFCLRYNIQTERFEGGVDAPASYEYSD